MGFDAAYDKYIIANIARLGALAERVERSFFVPLMALAEGVIKWFGRGTGLMDQNAINSGFDGACDEPPRRRYRAWRSPYDRRPTGLARSPRAVRI